MYALSAAAGAKVWSFPTGGPVSSSPAVADGVVYVGSDDNNVRSQRGRRGQGLELPDFPRRLQHGSSSSQRWRTGWSTSAPDDNNVYALSAATGAEVWSFRTEGSVRSSPAVADGVVYVGSVHGHVYALNADGLAELWSFLTGGGVTFAGGGGRGGLRRLGRRQRVLLCPRRRVAAIVRPGRRAALRWVTLCLSRLWRSAAPVTGACRRAARVGGGPATRPQRASGSGL